MSFSVSPSQPSASVSAVALTDRELVSRCAVRDAAALAALAELYDRHHQVVAALAYRLQPDPRRADDLVEVTFRSLWARSHCYHNGPEQLDVRAWLLGLARHHDQVRTRHPSLPHLPVESENMAAMAACD